MPGPGPWPSRDEVRGTPRPGTPKARQPRPGRRAFSAPGRSARLGIGRSLIVAAEAWARDHGLAHLTLHTGVYNASARTFYAVLGFAEEEVRLTRPVPPA